MQRPRDKSRWGYSPWGPPLQCLHTSLWSGQPACDPPSCPLYLQVTTLGSSRRPE